MKLLTNFSVLIIAVLLSANAMANNRQANSGVCAVRMAQPNNSPHFVNFKAGEALMAGIDDTTVHIRKFSPESLTTEFLSAELHTLVKQAVESGSSGILGIIIISWNSTTKHQINNSNAAPITGDIQIIRVQPNANFNPLNQSSNNLLTHETPEWVVAALGDVDLRPVNTRVAAACSLLR